MVASPVPARHALQLAVALGLGRIPKPAHYQTRCPWPNRGSGSHCLAIRSTWLSQVRFGSHVRDRLDAHLTSGKTLPPPWDEFLPFKATREDLEIVLAADRAPQAPPVGDAKPSAADDGQDAA